MRIRVVAAVIERAGTLLMCQRPDHKRHGGLWEFPGGKVDAGETDFAAVERELAEELGLQTLEVGGRILAIEDPDSAFVIEFLPVRIAGEPVRLEHADLAWTTPEEMLALPLAPSDLTFVEHLVSTGWPTAVSIRARRRGGVTGPTGPRPRA
jgi:mutator protein MutT